MKVQIRFILKKNLDLHLIKMQICFYFEEKFKSTSKEDVDPFFFKEKSRSTSKEDLDPFLFLKKKNC